MQKDGTFAKSVFERFKELFNSEQSVRFTDYQQEYTRRWKSMRKQRTDQESLPGMQPALRLEPNAMQRMFIDNLEKLISKGEKRALLVSATGTGKTYAAAFAIRRLHPKRVLFLVHREQIARRSLDSFRNVLGNKIRYGLLGGSHHDIDAQYLFSTVQTLSNPDVLKQFAADHFDFIIIDEVHRAGAPSYQRIFSHFSPKFWLGMSATPIRTDGISIYDLFNHNVVCRISLKDALAEDLLCPFRYYALSDLQIEGIHRDDPSVFSRLMDKERIRHILEEAEYYGYSGNRLKGLIFVSTNKEAEMLSEKLNEHGLRTMALSGDSSQQERLDAIERLVQEEDNEKALDYLLTVDIFNEGIDIPQVNQIILLRPTQSAIVFVQQLGRGLRKAPDKEFVVVLDFIGLHSNNYMIPEALSDTYDGSKDGMRRFVAEGTKTMPGLATVHFDQIARKRIFDAIDEAKLNSKQILREAFFTLKEELGRIPRLADYEKRQALDPLLIFSNKSYNSYPEFKQKMLPKEKLPEFNEVHIQFFRFVSAQWANGKRAHELLLLKALLNHPDRWKEEFEQSLKQLNLTLPKAAWNNIRKQFLRTWLSGSFALSQLQAVFLEENALDSSEADSALRISSQLKKAMQNPDFLDEMNDLIDFGLLRWKNRFSNPYGDGWFCLNERYTYSDTFRLLDYETQPVALNAGGYLFNETVNTFSVYINYQKASDISASIQYEDHFTSRDHLIAFSKNKRTLLSPEIVRLQNARQTGMSIPLFVRKSTDEEPKEFLFLGYMQPDGYFEEVTMADGKSRAVKIGYSLQHPVRADLYDYLTES